MSKLIYLDSNNLLCARKSCDICSHVSVCKLYNQVEKLFKSNEFYEMNIYLESNNIVRKYFTINLFHKYEEYFRQELDNNKNNKPWSKDKSDDELFRFCYSSANPQIYTIEANNHGWKEVINLVDVLEYFRAF